MKRLSLILALGCLTAMGAAQISKTTTLDGYISDSKCGAMHMDNGVGCVKKCIAGGYRAVFVDAKKKVWEIENPYSVKNFYGDNVKVDAVVNPSGKSIYVNNVAKTGGVMGGMKDGAPM